MTTTRPEIRCPACDRLLFKGRDLDGSDIEIRCKCKLLIFITSGKPSTRLP
jgi:hypothetical protein